MVLLKHWIGTSCMVTSSLLCSVHTADMDKTRLSCLVLSAVWTELESQVKTVGDRKFRNWTCLAFLHFCPVLNVGLDKTVQSQIYWRLLKTIFDLSPIQFIPPTQTRQDSHVLSVSAVWTRHYNMYIPTVDIFLMLTPYFTRELLQHPRHYAKRRKISTGR